MGFDMHQGAQTHSAAKSFAASLVGIAVWKYGLDLDQPGALAEWRKDSDPRGAITARHMLHMTSGLYGEGNGARYSAQFWIYGGIDGLPAGAYSPSGGQGQYAMIIPSHGTVVVRRGFDAGSGFRIAKFCADILAAFDGYR